MVAKRAECVWPGSRDRFICNDNHVRRKVVVVLGLFVRILQDCWVRKHRAPRVEPGVHDDQRDTIRGANIGGTGSCGTIAAEFLILISY